MEGYDIKTEHFMTWRLHNWLDNVDDRLQKGDRIIIWRDGDFLFGKFQSSSGKVD